ncbi:DUF998 domain-containing protein [Methanoculleus sp. YWC-01]|jgi:hypothetical membrane protein|uniref:DUF998 domain-containing protein n=1 Tax=Methanoculleus nereidis TaxID=2735141 RepID=A0ABU3Z4L7_9EURY|nr:DUF998 domain-containing protein [Methanoculleus sp. YWC-01]MCK9297710.1 DUF998 domain-containing protein [Methanoculleus sp.]MDV4343753.1 DUF998 domain-containing protein [Methanoculleus sp. YWC-01]PKL57304.1 MAG: DUF998 domain-containing protein [Methanomicrobiales archaeon HGW-Methanomicrobiales-6]
MRGTDSSRTIAGLLLFLLPVQFMTALMAGAAIAPGYSISQNAISDLGVIGATAWLFNASLFIAGLLNIVGGYFLYRSYGRGWIPAVFTLAGIGAIGAAIFTLEIPGIHGLFALLAFVFFNIQAISGATLVRGPLKAISVIAGAIGLVFLVTHAASDFGIVNLYGPIGHGGSERMIVYPALFWLMAFGGYLMAPSAKKR